ncbi:hypothetical protein [Methylobacterium sp. B1]|uniref:hypothetical protein n=1 Tax=Methylobacterium sp. B1 TaxID=91459 RepID=UPI00034BD552|nr:hypothetical protein [Methylobacterium sp. B1]
MERDLAPEDIPAAAQGSELTIEEALDRPDPSPDPEPGSDDGGQPGATVAAAHDYSGIRWPDQAHAPDFAWIAGLEAPAKLKLSPETFETLFKLNRYTPSREASVIAFALRGATLDDGHSAIERDEVALTLAEPNHRNFRCVIGFYFHKEGKISAFTGSTVPCRKAVYGSKNGGDASNMLPTGLYTYYVWRHKKLKPALRLGKSKSDLESGGRATVLRNSADLMLDTTDTFSPSTPLDNVHCSYYLDENADLGAQFSSWGCLTVRGTKAPSHEWAKFQSVLKDVGLKSRVDLILTTGKEASIVANSGNDAEKLEPTLGALRQGSRGDEVKRIQQKLGLEASGYWGAETADAFTGRQRALSRDAGKGPVADGIYGRGADALTGWSVFEDGVA